MVATNNRISSYLSDTYDEWQRRFPLKRLETEEQVRKANVVLKEMLDTGAVCSDGAAAYYKALTILVVEAESYHDLGEAPDVDDCETFVEGTRTCLCNHLEVARKTLAPYAYESLLSELATIIAQAR
jgi:hypothetical protein